MHAGTFETEYAEISETLRQYGFMVGPYILGGEFRALRDFCRSVRAKAPQSDADRTSTERSLDELLTSCVFNPNYRSFYVVRSISLPHLCEFSHLIERGVLHYYREDYLSCVLCLVPAVEGVLRSYTGLPDPSYGELVQKLRQGTATTYPGRYLLYVDAVAIFLDRWLYKRTDRADFRLSHLNRHYVLHALGSENFYRVTDCHRLLLFFDVFADLLTLEGHGPKYAMIPSGNPEMDRRRERYSKLIDPSAACEDRKVDESLLREHSRYVVEQRSVRLIEVVERFARVIEAR
jgi:hypothetical protein